MPVESSIQNAVQILPIQLRAEHALAKTRIPKRFGLDPIRDIQVLCPIIGAASVRGH